MTTHRDNLSLTFAALADPTRREILAILADGERTVTQLAEPFDLTQPAISKHLRVLERAGLVARGRRAQWRPARLQAAPLKEASDWVERYRRHWEESFDRLGAYLRRMQAKEQSSQPREVKGSRSQRTRRKARSPEDVQ
jgi:DNA-binding transcriptional ArsR family regulator